MDYSVIIRTKNSEKTIEACLESLFKQSLRPNEIIIVDSGSKDDTLSIVKRYSASILKYPDNIDFNYSKALNIGIENASSEFILILSSHVQLIDSRTVFMMFNVLNENENCKTVSVLRTDFLEFKDINPNEEFVFERIILDNFKGRAMYNFCSLIRKTSWENYNFNESIPRCEDQEWALHYLKKGYSAEVINNPKVYYNNPFYNTKKDAWDYIILGEYIFPYFISNDFVKLLIRDTISKIKKRNFKIVNYNLYIVISILNHKYIKKNKIISKYNKKLN